MYLDLSLQSSYSKRKGKTLVSSVEIEEKFQTDGCACTWEFGGIQGIRRPCSGLRSLDFFSCLLSHYDSESDGLIVQTSQLPSFEVLEGLERCQKSKVCYVQGFTSITPSNARFEAKPSQKLFGSKLSWTDRPLARSITFVGNIGIVQGK